MIAVINRICLHAYTLSMSLGLLVLLLIPVNRLGNHYSNVIETFQDNRVALAPGPTEGVEVGDQLEIYRFNHGWTAPIGHVEILEMRSDRWIAGFDPQEFAWPMGRQGQIVAVDGDVLHVNMGSDLGLRTGVILRLYDGPNHVGELKITRADPQQSTASVVAFTGTGDRVGLTVSEFVIPNQVAWFHAPLLEWLEGLLVGGLLLIWGWSVFSPVPGERFHAAGAALRGRLAQLPERTWRGLTVAALIPIVWVMGQIGWYTATRLAGGLTTWLAWAGMDVAILPFYPSWGAMPSVGLLAAVCVVVLLRGMNPLVQWARLVAYHPQTRGLFAVLPRGLLNWFLHLFVFYAFGSTLVGFFAGNMNTVASLGWAGAGLDFRSIQGAFDGTGYLLTHMPHPKDATTAFQMFRSLLAGVTIAGCLLGYGHTVFSILWKPNAIKNIDFTPWGWLVNAICYGPLLGDTIYVTAMHPFGVQPIVLGGGLFFWISESSGALLNLMYTLSILNLGTMFGVMVDKGVRKSGFYSVIRHPNYTFEPLMFMVGYANTLSTLAAWAAVMAFPIKYWLRSERDDQFMGASNPEYVKYREEVPWKFIRGLY